MRTLGTDLEFRGDQSLGGTHGESVGTKKRNRATPEHIGGQIGSLFMSVRGELSHDAEELRENTLEDPGSNKQSEVI